MGKRASLNPIKPVFPQVKVSPGEVLIGNTPAGNMIVKRTVTKVDRVPIMDPKSGEQRYRTNAVGQPVTPMFRKVERQVEETYEKIACRDGTVMRNYDFTPDPAEAAQKERAAKIREMQEKLAERLIDEGVSLDSFVSAVKGDEKKPRAKAAA